MRVSASSRASNRRARSRGPATASCSRAATDRPSPGIPLAHRQAHRRFRAGAVCAGVGAYTDARAAGGCPICSPPSRCISSIPIFWAWARRCSRKGPDFAAGGSVVAAHRHGAGGDLPAAPASEQPAADSAAEVAPMILSILDRHIGRGIFISTVLVFGVLLALSIFIVFVRAMADFGKFNFGLPELAHYVIMSQPRQLYELFPHYCAHWRDHGACRRWHSIRKTYRHACSG